MKKVNVIFLKEMLKKVPRGRQRSILEQAGQMHKLEFSRSMTCEEVKKVIENGFPDIENAKSAAFLACGQNNVLHLNKQQDLNGDCIMDLAGQGSLYLLDVRSYLL